MNRCIASIEARMGSSRFPGKVLQDINGFPAIERLVRRLMKSSRLDGIVLATTVNPLDDALEKWANGFGLPIWRGSEDDVLQRVVDAHRFMKSDTIVEITGDAILTDPDVVDLAIRTFENNDFDVVSTSNRKSFPLGIDAQVFHFRDLDWVARNVPDLPVREHVSLHFYEHPEKYRICHLMAQKDCYRPTYRLVLDYREDLEVFRKICTALDAGGEIFYSAAAICAFLDKHPEVVAMNAGAVVKPVR